MQNLSKVEKVTKQGEDEYFDFRHLIAVNKDVKKAVETLGYLLFDDPNTFDGVDLTFLGQFDYITAVPIQIALSYIERLNIMIGNPNVNFILTGINKEWVPALQKWGYEAWEWEIEETEEDRIIQLTPDNGKVSIYGKEYDVADVIEALDLRERVDSQLKMKLS